MTPSELETMLGAFSNPMSLIPGVANAPAVTGPVPTPAPAPAPVAPTAGFQAPQPVTPGLSLAGPMLSPGDMGMTSPVQPQSRPAMTPSGHSWEAIERAIDAIESGGTADRIGRWDQLGPVITNPRSRYRGDRAYGRFQFMGRDIPELTRRFYGRALTPQEFLANQEAQTAVFRGRFGEDMQRFGNPVDAAQAHFAGAGSVGDPSALDRTDAQAGFRGTSVRNYRRMFESALSRYSLGSASQGSEGFTPTSLELPPDFAAAGNLPSASLPPTGLFSPVGAAMAPGLAAASAASVAPQAPPMGQGGAPMQLAPAATLPANVARPGWFGILDQLGLASPGFAGTRPTPEGGFTPYGAWFDQLPIAQQQAAMSIFRRGQELQLENPTANPQQIAQLLLRDPVFGRNAMYVGTHGPAVLQAAVQPPTGPPTIVSGSPGQQFFENRGGTITPTGQGVPPSTPADIQTLQFLAGLPPGQREQMLSLYNQWRQAQQLPSDREQAFARLLAAGQVTPDMRDLFLAGVIRPEPITNAQGQVVGTRMFNSLTGQFLSDPVIRHPGTGGPPGTAAPPVAPGATVGAPVTAPVTPPAGVTGAPTTAAPVTGAPVTGAPVTPPGTIRTEPRVVGRQGDREVVDFDGLSLRPGVLADPAHMALGAGPVSGFLGVWGRVLGNLLPGTQQDVLDRQNALQQFRSAYASYRRGAGGRQLAGEHAESMAEVPTPGQILTNPLESVQKFISIREGLVQDLILARQQSQDQSLHTHTRQVASDRVAEIQGILTRMATIPQYHALAAQLREGANIPGISPGDVLGTVTEDAAKAGIPLPGQRPATALPEDLSSLDLPALRRLSLRPNLTQADRQRLIEALNALSSGRPAVPRSY